MEQNFEKFLRPAEAKQVLEQMGIVINDRQLRRGMEPDAKGRRKLPFFKDPVTGLLIISESKLREVYRNAQAQAEKNTLKSSH